MPTRSTISTGTFPKKSASTSASVVRHNLDHLAIGKPSLLTSSGAPLWGEPVWGKGKEERGTGELCSYRT